MARNGVVNPRGNALVFERGLHLLPIQFAVTADPDDIQVIDMAAVGHIHHGTDTGRCERSQTLERRAPLAERPAEGIGVAVNAAGSALNPNDLS